MPTGEPILGRPARTFAQWARDHADDSADGRHRALSERMTCR